MRKKDVPDLDALFRRLKQGQMPDFLQLMAAIEDVGAFVVEPNSASCELRSSVEPSSDVYLYPSAQFRCPDC